MIPKIIHQIAPKDRALWHPLWFKCQESWLKHFNDCEYILWNDKEDIDNFVEEHYPEFKSLYNLFPVHIMKIDFVRLCILHKFGGIYADMDYFVYKNFYKELTNDIGFLQNLTNEYTTAEFENSLMYSTKDNSLWPHIMKYSKACFIHYRNNFKKELKHWRLIQYNNSIVNNTTGSGMLSMFLNHIKDRYKTSFGFLDCETYNNRPASFDKSFFGKHIHTSLWGEEYTSNKPTHFLIKNNSIYCVVDKIENITLNNEDLLIKCDEFDFFKDYTKGKFLKHDNLEEIKKNIEDANYT